MSTIILCRSHGNGQNLTEDCLHLQFLVMSQVRTISKLVYITNNNLEDDPPGTPISNVLLPS